MADRFYSGVLGDQFPVQVTEGSSSSSEAIELRINDSAYGYGKIAILNALEAIKNYIITKETNPIA